MRRFVVLLLVGAAAFVRAEAVKLGDFVWENGDAKRLHNPGIPIAGLTPGVRAEVTMWVDAGGLSKDGVPEASLAWGSRRTGSKWATGSSTVWRWNDKEIERKKVKVEGQGEERELRKFVCRTVVMPTDGIGPELHFFAKPPATGRIVYSDIEVKLFPRTYAMLMANDAYANAADAGDVRFAVSFITDPDREPVERLSGTFVFTGADGREVRQSADRLTATTAEKTFPVASFAKGMQDVRFELSLDGKVLSSTTCPFERLEKPVARRVSFDRFGRTLTDGKPFFPLGMYWSENTLSLSNALERYVAPGVFNSLQTYEKAMTPEILDRYWAKGLRVMASVKDVYLPKADGNRVKCFLPAGIRTKEQEAAYVSSVVNRCKDHPALLAWYTCDEMDGCCADILEDRYRLMKRLDPDHPVYVLAFSRFTGAFMRAYDVTGMDPYPVCPLGNTDRPGLGAVWRAGDEAVAVREGMFALKPLWQVPQAFKWQWDFKDKYEARFPTRRELSSMTWQQIAEGANGIFFYSYGQMCNHCKNESELIEYFDGTTVPVARELKSVEDVLLAEPGPAVTAKPARVRVRTWKKDGAVYALVCNTHPEFRTGTVAIEGSWTACEPVFGTGVTLENGRLALAMGPIATAMVKLGSEVLTDGAALPVEGKAFADTPTPWSRLPERFKGKVSASTWNLSRQSAGLYYSFTTTATRVTVRWSLTGKPQTMPHMAATGSDGVDVYWRKPDGSWRYLAAGKPTGQADNSFSFVPRKGAVHRVYLPLYNGIRALSFVTEAGTGICPVREFADRKPIVCYGGSVVQGACSSRPGMAWANQFGRLVDAPVVNLGCSGQGVMTDADLDVLSEIDARGYVLMTLGNMKQDVWLKTYEHFVRTLEARRPRTPMVLCSWHYPLTGKCRQDEALEDLKLRLTREDWSAWGGMLFVVPNADLCPPDGDSTVDGGHPNDYGAHVMAHAVASSAEVAFPPYRRTVPILETPLTEEKEKWARGFAYEPREPKLDSPSAPGFHGRVAPLAWIDADDAVGSESDRTLRLRAWRNERVHGQVVVWSDKALTDVRFEAGDLVSDTGARIGAKDLTTRFVRYVLTWGRRAPTPLFRGDCLDPRESLDLSADGFRPAWLTVSVPAAAAAGVYRGTLAVRANGGARIDFPVELEVLDASLPAKNDFFLDIWQQPWRIAMTHQVKPFSSEHYALLEPHYREMAAAGQKVITTWIEDSVWGPGEQNPRTLVKYCRHRDGRSTFDFTLFDEYVAFARKCGIGPQIHCYSLVNWEPLYHYWDAETGDRVEVKAEAGDAAWKDYWRPLLKAIEAHAREKGLLGDVYIALDEVGKKGETVAANFLRETAPGLKLTMAGCECPERYGFPIDTYSEALQHEFVSSPELEADILARRKAGRITTFYITCWPLQPNAGFRSDFSEQRWLGLYAALKHYDGFLRWAMHLWPRDPLFGDLQYSTEWTFPGSWFFAYPGAQMSVRWEMLRDSIENWRKIEWLRRNGRATDELEAALKAVDFPAVKHADVSVIREKVADVEAAIDAAVRAK